MYGLYVASCSIPYKANSRSDTGSDTGSDTEPDIEPDAGLPRYKRHIEG